VEQPVAASEPSTITITIIVLPLIFMTVFLPNLARLGPERTSLSSSRSGEASSNRRARTEDDGGARRLAGIWTSLAMSSVTVQRNSSVTRDGGVHVGGPAATSTRARRGSIGR